MCGIAGYWSKEKAVYGNELTDLTDSMAHRGPDASGTYRDMGGLVGLGHRRLSILDLSEESNQPFFSGNGRYVMVFNGEIYNYRDIAKKYNIPTHTTSDTEVILEHFVIKGVDAVQEWNGMFALAIWDRVDKKLFLFRDRLGKKPLYYYNDGEILIFASELKSIRQHISLTINRSAIPTYLFLGFFPKEMTVYKDVKQLLPGHYASYDKHGWIEQSYWKIDDQIRDKPLTFRNIGEAKNILRGLMEDSVNIRMAADVPVGTFLSGGIDSSIVTAVAQSINDKPVKSFSIGFDDPKYNEAPYAAEIAKYLGTEHHQHIVSMKDALELAPRLMDIYDEPFVDSSAIPTLLVSKMARQKVTVILTGDGGDETFLGYGMYDWAKRLSNPLVKTLRWPAYHLLNEFGNQRQQRAAKMFAYPDDSHLKSHLFSQEQYLFSASEIIQLLHPSINADIDIVEEAIYNRQLSAAEEQSIFDINYYLPDDLLVKVDRATMHYSLEGRCPLLDYRIVEFAINLPVAYKKQGATSKYLLRQLLYDYVPEKYFNRPKWGFAVPLSEWLLNDLSYMIDNYLNSSVIENAQLVRNEPVQKLVKEFRGGKTYLYNRVWSLIILHQWFCKYGD